ncbi:MAG: DUF1460 domain-containing protein [Akkermansiaceae bacterium]|nr:DUF1460 domain-containing protein [Akkermansiaceae bacterium]
MLEADHVPVFSDQMLISFVPGWHWAPRSHVLGVGILSVTLAMWRLEISVAITPETASLPRDVTFVGEANFERLLKKAVEENWAELPIGECIAKVAIAFQGTKYQTFPMEIDDHIEAPSVNLEGMDCWTFFEISLAFARMLKTGKSDLAPQDLLDQIECLRYRGGECHGSYLDRLHYVSEWIFEAESRGIVENITNQVSAIPPASVFGKYSS